MGYRLAADAILVLHASFIAFVVAGLVAVVAGWWRGWRWVRSPWFRVGHLVAIGYVVVQAWLGAMCPLTIWEGELRIRAGQDPYAPEGFVAYWLQTLIFFEAPAWVFTLVYTLFGLAVAATLVFVPVRWRGRGRGPGQRATA